jgi:hypothetical protein
LFGGAASRPIVNLQNSANTASADFYGNATGTALTTGPNGSGSTLAAWITTNGAAYVATWYDQAGAVNGGTYRNATASGSQRPVINTTTTPWTIDCSTTGTYFNLPSGTIPMNSTYTLSGKLGSYVVNNGIMGAGNQATNQANAILMASPNIYNYWYANDLAVTVTPTSPFTFSFINYFTSSAPTTTTGVTTTGGTTTTNYTTATYFNTASISAAARGTGWAGVPGNDVLCKGLNNPGIGTTMYWAFISQQAISGNDRAVVEAQ